MAKKSLPKARPKARRTRAEVRDINECHLLQARGAITTAILALENKAVLGEIAVMLRICALKPLLEITND